MKKYIIITISIFSIILISLPVTSIAKINFGAGIILGEPTGLCAKLWTGKAAAIDFALAWSFSGNDSMHIHSDYLFHNFDLFQAQKGKLPVYYGIGARLRFWEQNKKNDDDTNDKAKLGVRIPVGLAYLFDEAPIDVFLEIVPVLDILPDMDFTLNAAIGARYFFY